MIFYATVTKVEADGPYVEVPDLGVGLEFGPLESISSSAAVPLDVVAGDRVLVCTVGKIRDDLAIMGVLTLPTSP